jgi:hypothetical protein
MGSFANLNIRVGGAPHTAGSHGRPVVLLSLSAPPPLFWLPQIQLRDDERLVALEVFHHRVQRILNEQAGVCTLNDHDSYYVYRLPKGIDGVTDLKDVILYHRKVSPLSLLTLAHPQRSRDVSLPNDQRCVRRPSPVALPRERARARESGPVGLTREVETLITVEYQTTPRLSALSTTMLKGDARRTGGG